MGGTPPEPSHPPTRLPAKVPIKLRPNPKPTRGGLTGGPKTRLGAGRSCFFDFFFFFFPLACPWGSLNLRNSLSPRTQGCLPYRRGYIGREERNPPPRSLGTQTGPLGRRRPAEACREGSISTSEDQGVRRGGNGQCWIQRGPETDFPPSLNIIQYTIIH